MTKDEAIKAVGRPIIAGVAAKVDLGEETIQGKMYWTYTLSWPYRKPPGTMLITYAHKDVGAGLSPDEVEELRADAEDYWREHGELPLRTWDEVMAGA